MNKKEYCISHKGIIDSINVPIYENSFNFIIGRSGVGKTTLLKELSKQLTNVAFAFQEDKLVKWLTVFENLKLVNNTLDKSYINDVMKDLDLNDIVDKYPNHLSGGQKQRINLLRAFITDAKYVILDETFNALDYLTKDLCINFVKNNLKDKTIIIVSHDLEVVCSFKGYINLLYKDQVLKINQINNLNQELNANALLDLVKEIER